MLFLSVSPVAGIRAFSKTKKRVWRIAQRRKSFLCEHEEKGSDLCSLRKYGQVWWLGETKEDLVNLW